MNLLQPTYCAIVQTDNQQKAVELCGSGLLAGVGRANNAGNVGNANNAYWAAGSNTYKNLAGSTVLAEITKRLNTNQGICL